MERDMRDAADKVVVQSWDIPSVSSGFELFPSLYINFLFLISCSLSITWPWPEYPPGKASVKNELWTPPDRLFVVN